MKTMFSILACCVLFAFIHVEAATDMDSQSLLVRLSVLEEKQAFSEKLIAALETENKMSQKRIADLEKYKTLSDRRVASLERTNVLCNRRKVTLDSVKELHANQVTLDIDNILPDKTNTTNGYNNTMSDKKVASIVKERILSNRKSATPENDNAVSSDRSGKDERYTAFGEIADRPTSVLQSKHRRLVAEGIVAFSAMKIANQEHIGINQNIIFENVLTNEGGGFRANHGVFIVPQSGVYMISSSIMCAENGEVRATMVHNGNLVARVYCHGDGGKYDQGSQTVVIQLNAGDEVAVQSGEFADDKVWGFVYSSFSGYLVWPQ